MQVLCVDFVRPQSCSSSAWRCGQLGWNRQGTEAYPLTSSQPTWEWRQDVPWHKQNHGFILVVVISACHLVTVSSAYVVAALTRLYHWHHLLYAKAGKTTSRPVGIAFSEEAIYDHITISENVTHDDATGRTGH